MMRVAYVYDLRANDIMVQSGRPWSILRQLQRRANVEPVFPISHWKKYLYTPKYAFYRSVHLTYRPDREPAVLRSMARQIERRLARMNFDRIFAPGSHVLTFLDSDVPKVLCSDATFASVVGQYGDFSDCAPEYLRQGHAQEAMALEKCKAVIYPSEWAARSAIEDYGVDPHKVHVVPFGANLEVPPPAAIAEAIELRDFDRLRVLFVGRDWRRKGGNLVLEAAALARRDGVPVQVDIVGPSSCPAELPDYARYHGLLVKSEPNDRSIFEKLMREAHILFVPSRAENFGMSFCEAAAFGIPSLATAVGGIPTIVRTGISGWSLPLEAGAPAYAEILGQCYADPGRYRLLAHSSREFYDANLTWDAFGERLIQILS
jgi:glycosyltransferase involved in cell wall biosynthesis